MFMGWEMGVNLRTFCWVVCFFLLTVGLACPVLAELGPTRPEAIQREIDRLRVHYTDEHPDIQRLLRHLEKAKARENAEKARQDQREKLENKKNETNQN
jgi:hypothetical protein